MSIGDYPGDEFASLKELVENLRASLPPLDGNQHQLVGVYLLAALRLGKGEPDYLRVIDDYFARPVPHKGFKVIEGGIADSLAGAAGAPAEPAAK